MNLPSPLDLLPPETMVSVPLTWLEKLLVANGEREPEIVTTPQASQLWSYSSDTWSGWCREGKIAGAWQDGAGGIWRMPYESCNSHVERLRLEARQSTAKKRKRTPWGNSPSTQTGRARPKNLPERKVVPLRPASVRGRQGRDAEPEPPQLAGRRRAHIAQGDS